jgi:hypothetical protein
MKPIYLLPFMLLVYFSNAQNNIQFNTSNAVFINEFHYDNMGSDTLEGVEIAALIGTDLPCYKLYFINGYNGSYYGSLNFDSIPYSESCGLEFRYYLKSSIQNGSSSSGDGILLYNNCDSAVVQFISYEGVVEASNGPFIGAISQDIAVSENGSSMGTSLQLQGSLDSGFVWLSDSSSFGQINDYQNFCQTKVELNHLQVDSSCVLTENETITLSLKNISYSNATDTLVVFLQANDSVYFSDTASQSIALGDSLAFTFSQTLDLSQDGSYHFKVWAHSDSILNSDTLFHSIELYDDDTITIDLENSVVHCHNEDSLVLSVQVSGADYYAWNTGDTTQQLVVLPQSDTTFYFIAHNLCYSDTAWVEVDYVKPEINFIGIYEGDTLYENENGEINYTNIGYVGYLPIYLTTIEFFDSYDYVVRDFDGDYIINTSIDSSIALTYENGLSSVGCAVIMWWIILEVVDTNGCTFKDSTMVVEYGVDIVEISFQTLSVFPNPSSGLFSIDMNGLKPDEQFSLELINSLGQVVEARSIASSSSQLHHSLDWRHLTKGLYHIQLQSKQRKAYKRLIIH